MWQKEDFFFDCLTLVFISIFFVIVAYPLYFIIIASVSNARDVYEGKVVFLPSRFSLEGYKYILEYKEIWIGYKNTIIYAVFGTLFTLVVTFSAAYPLSHKNFVGKKIIMLYFTITMFFSGGLIPTYLLIKALGMLDHPTVMIIPGAVSVWNIIVVRTFIQSNVPYELYESASIDGSSHTTYFFKILLPLSTASIAVITLFSVVGHWNAFFSALIYLRNRELFPLQLILREILVSVKSQELLMDAEMMRAAAELESLANLIKYGAIIVGSLPLLVAYPFLQRYFMKGVLIGSIKG